MKYYRKYKIEHEKTKTTTTLLKSCSERSRICQENTGYRNHGAAGDRVLLVSICILKLKLSHKPAYPNPTQDRAGLCRSANTPKITG